MSYHAPDLTFEISTNLTVHRQQATFAVKCLRRRSRPAFSYHVACRTYISISRRVPIDGALIVIKGGVSKRRGTNR